MAEADQQPAQQILQGTSKDAPLSGLPETHTSQFLDPASLDTPNLSPTISPELPHPSDTSVGSLFEPQVLDNGDHPVKLNFKKHLLRGAGIIAAVSLIFGGIIFLSIWAIKSANTEVKTVTPVSELKAAPDLNSLESDKLLTITVDTLFQKDVDINGSLTVKGVAVLGTSLTVQDKVDINGSLTVAGDTVIAGNFKANNLTAGTIQATTITGSGADLDNLNATNITQGTLADARLTQNVALLNRTQAFTGANSFEQSLSLQGGLTSTTATFSGRVSGASAVGAQDFVTLGQVSGTISNAFLQGGNSFGTTATIGTNDGFDLSFETAGVEKLRILQNGNVGIGTSNPTRALDVLGTIQASNGFLSSTAGINTVLSADANGSYVEAQGANNLRMFTNGTERLRINSSGNIGIGELDPQRRLVVRTDTAGSLTNTALYNADTSNGNGVTLSFRTDTTGVGATAFREVAGVGSITTIHDNATRNTDLRFFTDSAATGGTYKMVIQGNGNVGIGTITPQAKLDVVLQDSDGSNLPNATFTVYGTNNGPGLRGKRFGGTQASPTATLSGMQLLGLAGQGYDGASLTANSGSISIRASENYTSSASGSYIAFVTTATGSILPSERVRIDPSGNVGIGTAAPASALHVDNGFITSGRYGTPGALVLQAAGGTQSVPTALTNASASGTIVMRGYDGSAYRDLATITASPTDASVTAGSSAGNLLFSTTPTGSTTAVSRVIIGSSGNVGIGDISPAALFTVGNGDLFQVSSTGTVLAKNSANTTTAFQIQNAAGTPLLTEDTTTGKLTVRGTATDATVGSNQITITDFTNVAWTSTGWTTTTTTATHNSGNTNALSTTQVSVTAGTNYIVTFTVTGNTNPGEKLTANIGGTSWVPVSGATTTTYAAAITASTTGNLQFIPTTNWNGTVSSVQVNVVAPTAPVLAVTDGNTVSSALQSAADIVTISRNICTNCAAGAPSINIITANNTVFSQARGVFKGTLSRGTLTSPTVPLQGDHVVSFMGAAYDGVTNQATAMISAIIDGTVSAGVAPQRFGIFTSATDAAARTERLTVSSVGNVGIGTTNPAVNLDVRGTNAKIQAGTAIGNILGVSQTGFGASNGTEVVGFAAQSSLGFAGTISNTNFCLTTNNICRLTVTTTGNLLLAQGANRSLSVVANTTADGAGFNLSVDAGAANGTTTGNVGGALALTGGAAAGSGNNNGGNVTIDGGAKTASGTVGNVVLQGTNGGNVGIGTSAPSEVLEVQSDNSATRGTILGYYANDNSGSLLKLQKSRSATKGAHTILQNNDIVGQQAFQGSDGVQFHDAAMLRAEIDGVTGLNDMPGRLVFYTTPDGSNSSIERLRVTNAGNVGIGTNNPFSKLHVQGAGRFVISDATVIATPQGGSAEALNLANTDPTSGNTIGLKFTDGTPPQKVYAAIETIYTNRTLGAEAGTLAFTTINGGVRTEKLRVLANGNIGIGTTAPTSLLHAVGSQPATVATNGTAATQVLGITGGKGGNTTGTTAQVGGTGATVIITSGAGGDAPAGSTNGNGGNISVQTGAPGAGVGAAGSYGNLILNSSGGNVGIGEANPGAKLAVNGNIQLTDNFPAVNSIGITNQTITHDAKTISRYGSNFYEDTWYAGAYTNTQSAYGGFKFLTNDTLRLAISRDGNVGISATMFGTNNRLLINPYNTVDNLATAQINANVATNKGLVVQGFASQTADLFQAQDSAGVVLASIDSAGNLSVKNASIAGTLTVNGHLITGNTTGTTTIVAGAASCTTPTVSISGNDTAGTITVTTGTGCAATGVLATITFAGAYGAAPRVVISADNAAASGLNTYTGSRTTTTFTLDTGTVPTNTTTYTFNYFVAQ